MRSLVLMLVLILSTSVAGQQGTFKISGQGTMKTSTSGGGPLPPPANCGDPGVHCTANCSREAVLQAISEAQPPVNGIPDTIVLPECTNTNVNDNSQGNVWTQSLQLFENNTKVVNLVGQGMQNTIILANLPAANTSAIVANNGNVDTQGFRISDLTIQEMSNPVSSAGTAQIMITTGSHGLRLDHIHFKALGTHGSNPGVWGYYVGESVWGVGDHLWWDGYRGANGRSGQMKWGNTSDSTVSYADRTWSDPSTYGTEAAWYIEDSVEVTENANSVSYGCNVGSRCVWRYNTIPQIGAHGTDSAGRTRGVRQWEVYDNKFICPQAQQYGPVLGLSNNIIYRGGTGMVYDNDIVLAPISIPLPDGTTYDNPSTTCFGGTISSGGPQVLTYRAIFPLYRVWGPADENTYGGCTGTAPFDNNDTTGGPNNNGLWDSGTAKSVGSCTVNGVCPMTDDTKTWTPGRWVGYMVRRPGTAPNWNNGKATRVWSNDTNTLYTEYQSSAWNVGDIYEIRRVYDCIDSQGRGQSAYLYGGTPSCQPLGLIPGSSIQNIGCAGGVTSGPGWVQNKVEPTYTWNNWKVMPDGSRRQYSDPPVSPGWSFFPGYNSNGAIFAANNNSNSPIMSSRDWFEQDMNFVSNNGTHGMGVGPVAQRPATCSVNLRHQPDGTPGPGVGWWDPNTKQLTVCSAPNTWTLYYTPLPHPHPLQSVSTLSKNGHVIEDGAGHVFVHPKLRKHKKRPARKVK